MSEPYVEWSLATDEYKKGYAAGRESMLPDIARARNRIAMLTTWSHEYDPNCLCLDCALFKRLDALAGGEV